MTIEGVDYSSGRPGGAALVAAGKVFACRYLQYRGNPNPRKPLTLGEIDDLHGHGIAIVAAFESTDNRALDGHAAGASDGVDALAAMKGLGFPTTCPAYFGIDFDPQPRYLARIDDYFKGIATTLPLARIGVYGGYAVLGHLRTKGLATWFWQATGWSGGHEYALGHIHQYQTGGTGAKPINGAAVDYDRALKANYGQWDPPGGAGPAQPVEEDVIYTHGGLQTAVVSAGTGLRAEPAGPIVGTVTKATRFFVRGYDATGKYIAIDGLYAAPAGAKLVGCSWVAATGVGSFEDAVPPPPPPVDCTAAIAADRAKAHIVYE